MLTRAFNKISLRLGLELKDCCSAPRFRRVRALTECNEHGDHGSGPCQTLTSMISVTGSTPISFSFSLGWLLRFASSAIRE